MAIELQDGERDLASLGGVRLTSRRIIADYQSVAFGFIPAGSRSDVAELKEVETASVRERRHPALLVLGATLVVAALLLPSLREEFQGSNPNLLLLVVGLVVGALYFFAADKALILTVSGQPFVDLSLRSFGRASSAVEDFVKSLFEAKRSSSA